MSPNVRRAFHQALDLVLDALAEEQREQPTPRKRRGQAVPTPIVPTRALTPEEQEQLDRQLRRNGYRKAG